VSLEPPQPRGMIFSRLFSVGTLLGGIYVLLVFFHINTAETALKRLKLSHVRGEAFAAEGASFFGEL
jgi:hypothetical protein